MSLTFKDLQDEVKRRATRDEGGTQFDPAVKNLINMALIRVANETPWRSLRETFTVDTDPPYTTGTVTTTLDSKTWTGLGSSWLTSANARKGRRIKVTNEGTGTGSASSLLYRIDTIDADTTITTERAYDSNGDSTITYKILGREDYTLPAQCGRVAIIWHEGFGYPCPMRFVTDREFFDAQIDFDESDTPTMYRMWTEDYVLEQPKAASVVQISSSDAGDTATVTVHGIVSDYPDFETILTNGTTTVNGTKSFTKIDRITKNSSTDGRITATANSGNTTLAVLPVGDTQAGLKYKHIQVFPPPDATYVLNIWYYKDPARLVDDTDIHELGSDFDEVIILLATAKLQAEQSKKDVENFFVLYNAELKILRRKNADKLDWLPRLKRPRASRSPRVARNLTYSQIGSKYGPSSRF